MKKKGKGHKKSCKCCFCFHRKRWSNKPWSPSDYVLEDIDDCRKRGWSYRKISKLIGRDHVTLRRYYLRWLKNRSWFSRFIKWFKFWR